MSLLAWRGWRDGLGSLKGTAPLAREIPRPGRKPLAHRSLGIQVQGANRPIPMTRLLRLILLGVSLGCSVRMSAAPGTYQLILSGESVLDAREKTAKAGVDS